MSEFIVPGHPIGDCIPDVGEKIVVYLMGTAPYYAEDFDRRYRELCDNFMRKCEYRGVHLMPLRSRIATGKKVWKWSREFRVESLDPSRFLRNYQQDTIAAAMMELGELPASWKKSVFEYCVTVRPAC